MGLIKRITMKNKKLKEPVKPIEPIRPKEPLLKIKFNSDNISYYVNINDVVEIVNVVSHFESKLPCGARFDFSNLKFELDISTDYDGGTYSNSRFYYESDDLIDNPNYTKEIAQYKKKLAKYMEDFKKYEIKSAQYTLDKANYDKLLKEREIENALAVLEKYKVK